MPEDDVIERARANERERKSPSTQAGEFVREEKVVHTKESWVRCVAQSEARTADSCPYQLFPVERLPQVSSRVTTSLHPL
jgi:hypothetical protein